MYFRRTFANVLILERSPGHDLWPSCGPVFLRRAWVSSALGHDRQLVEMNHMLFWHTLILITVVLLDLFRRKTGVMFLMRLEALGLGFLPCNRSFYWHLLWKKASWYMYIDVFTLCNMRSKHWSMSNQIICFRVRQSSKCPQIWTQINHKITINKV